MIKIKRKMEVEEISKTEKYMCYSQASFNSDNCLTIRNYNDNKNEDEIIILNDGETRAIIKLFEKLKQNNLLPF